jgi:hypothetical protein
VLWLAVGAMTLAGVALWTRSATAIPSALPTNYRSCGRIHSRYGPFLVYVKQGRVSCASARSVIAYVTSHGTPTQGTPGTSPRGWNCYFGYGYYHHHHDQLGRAGPECKRAAKIVEGVDPAYTPA